MGDVSAPWVCSQRYSEGDQYFGACAGLASSSLVHLEEQGGEAAFMELLWAGGLTDAIYKIGGGRGWGRGSGMEIYSRFSQLQHRDVWGWNVLSRGRLFCVVGCLAASWRLPDASTTPPSPPPARSDDKKCL